MDEIEGRRIRQEHEPDRLRARPDPRVDASLPPGLHRLGMGAERDGLLWIPAPAEGPPGLLVFLHGAGANARQSLDLIGAPAADFSMALLAPDSRGRTWEGVSGDGGTDLAFLEAALGDVMPRHPFHPDRLALGGFSDGASYALTLGLANGDLFPGLVAFSPGFAAPKERRGQPRIFVSHRPARRRAAD
jgi:phospholipase/carboxylesterase